MDPKETTNVEVVDMSLDSLFGSGADSVMLPANEEDKKENNMFARTTGEDVSFLDKAPVKDAVKKDELDEKGQPKVEPILTKEELTNILNPSDDDDDSKTTGRPRMDKAGLVELTNKLIEKNIITPFDDDKPIDKYTLQDFEELFEMNAQEKERKVRDAVPAEFFKALPPELQYAAKYAADGGTDLKGLFRSLAAVEEVKSLDPSNPHDQRQIISSYLQATDFGTDDEIEEEINGWDDHNELEAKALKFHPKLNALSEKHVQYKVAQQEQMNKQRAEQSQLYMDNVYKTLEPAELSGLKLDKKTQNLLFTGLVQPNYQSVSGKQTNLLGHLLEKYQFIEPNHGLVAEALWLLADPDGYRTKMREVEKKGVVATTVRSLKGEESKKIASHVEPDEDIKTTKKPGLARPNKGFFAR